MDKFLLVVDMQNGFINNDSYKSLVNKINSLIENSHYETIIFTKFMNS